ncbi:MAG: hypothetical protein R3C25_04895 [Hyphomonadaceae bacterium]
MRGLLAAAALALATACSAPQQAAAQASGDFSGTWAFQTQSYGSDQVGAVMSGAAILTSGATQGHYDVRLLAHELLVNRDTGQSRMLTARETCTGVDDGAQVTITCQMAEPLEGYSPDDFVLQRGEADELVGVLGSNANSQVTFTRLR